MQSIFALGMVSQATYWLPYLIAGGCWDLMETEDLQTILRAEKTFNHLCKFSGLKHTIESVFLVIVNILLKRRPS